MNSQIVALFPVLIHRFEVEYFKTIQKDLIDFCYGERRKDTKGRRVSNRGGWQSKSNMGYDKDGNSNVLVQTVQQNIIKYFHTNRVMHDDVRISLNNMLININKKGSYNIVHLHPACELSGVLWIKTPEKCGNLNFISPCVYSRFKETLAYETEYGKKLGQHTTYEFLPKEGEMMLFPSSIEHSVNVNESREDRISVSFNLHLHKDSWLEDE